jgi:hypothetical protein
MLIIDYYITANEALRQIPKQPRNIVSIQIFPLFQAARIKLKILRQ